MLNKIDLPSADPEKVKSQIEDVIGLDASDAIETSGKTGLGVDNLLEAVMQRFADILPIQRLIRADAFVIIARRSAHFGGDN